MGRLKNSLRSSICLIVFGLARQAAALAHPAACPLKDAQGGRCVEACALPGGPEARPSDLFVAKLRTIASAGYHLAGQPGPLLSQPVSQFRVASIPFSKEEATRWRQNGLWAGPCAGLSAVFQASAVDDKDARKVVDLYELHYTSEATARRIAALLGSSWDWNGHPSIAMQRGANVIVAEGRYGAWNTLEKVGAHFGGAAFPRGEPVSLPVCSGGARLRPIFEGDGLTVHVVGFAPSGELAWLERRGDPKGETVWTLHVNNLVNDHEVAARTYKTAAATPDAFCAEHRAEVGALLSEHGVAGGQFSAFDKPVVDGSPMTVMIQPAFASAPASAKEVVMQGPPGTKVLGKLPAGTAAQPLGVIRSPFEERVAVLVLVKDAASGRSGLRVLGGRLDKRWLPRQ